ncbi:hypothetical protein DFH11DRAFT_1516674 [Phellopilus nigrolimitatus]|nr:hypothetical protein DFH11DRAFT_1516674 [Phellopilus nigrolimitatus]
MSKQQRLVDLPADVLLRILALCDVEDVLRVEMTCRVLRDIVATQHLWLSHLRGLPNDCAPNLPPHISVVSLDSIGLKTLVVRAVRGNRNWSSPSPNVTREIKVTVNNPTREPALFVNEASLVPGDDYLVVHWESGQPDLWKDNCVQLLEVPNGEKIWLYPDPDYSGSMLRMLWVYSVDCVSEDILRVATAETDSPISRKLSDFFPLSRSNKRALTYWFFRIAIKIFEIDLRQRRSEKIYDFQLVNDHLMEPRNLYLQGDHIVLVGWERILSFLNWKSSCCANLESVSFSAISD